MLVFGIMILACVSLNQSLHGLNISRVFIVVPVELRGNKQVSFGDNLTRPLVIQPLHASQLFLFFYF